MSDDSDTEIETGNFILIFKPESDDSDNDLLTALDVVETLQGEPFDMLDESERRDLMTAEQRENPTVSNPPLLADDKVDTSVSEGAVKEELRQERFPALEEDDLDTLVANTNSIHTDKMTKWGVNVFIHWLGERGFEKNFEQMDPEELDNVLRRFYAEIRNAHGNYYSKSTFVGIRASINRYLRSPPHNKTYSLLEDKQFHKSNQMFKAMLKVLKKEGQDKTTHYSPISSSDLTKLKSSGVFSIDNPRSLQRKVWFEISISFARRGRENLSNLKHDCFLFKRDDAGFEYVQMAYHEATKNHQGDDLKDDDNKINPRMYATNNDSCPVLSLRKYLKKRNPASNHFFQQPRVRVNEDDEIWYTSRPVGPRTLNDMMKTLSSEAGLSKQYTNHCVRATTITLLSHAGVETREIMKISGHKNEASVRSYNSDSSDGQKRAYSAIIHDNPPEQPLINASNREVVPFSDTYNHANTSTHSHLATSRPPASSSSRNFLANINQNVFQYNSQLPRSVTYQKQFEVNQSTVHVYNYFGNLVPQ